MKTVGIIFTFVCILMVIIISSGCKSENYKYEWNIEVTYSNGDIDTLHHELIVPCSSQYQGRISLYSNRGSGCVVAHGDNRERTNLACGVRKFKILSEKKIIIN